LTRSQEVYAAFVKWSERLQAVPGWREWNRAKISFTLAHGDGARKPADLPDMFELSAEMDAQHAAMMAWLHLNATVRGMRACSSYLRHAPDHRLGISTEDHLRYMIELYFSRVYEFSERLKKMMNALSATIAPAAFNTGDFVKDYKKVFRQEIAERNSTHHDEHFDDVSLDQLGLVNLIGQTEAGRSKGWKQEHRWLWRRSSKEWRARIDRGADKTQLYVEGVAGAMIDYCPWLTD
jgi:hypothetical protein